MTAARTDANQREIVAALRQCGYSVCCLHAVGHGVPDLLVGGVDRATDEPRNWLLEIKAERGRLTPDQWHWHSEWRGRVDVVRSVDDALRAVGAMEEEGMEAQHG